MKTITTQARSGLAQFYWTPIVLPLGASLILSFSMPPWAAMWLLAASIYWSFKWFTLIRFIESGGAATTSRAWGYLLAWPGMDAAEFFATDKRPSFPTASQWLAAAGKIFLGAALFWRAEFLAFGREIVCGWLGMIGLILMLHFGLFHILTLVWRQAGVNVRPLMNKPLLAASLSDFWAKRWNRAFRDLSYLLVFRPVVGRWGTAAATMAVFFASGVVHDVVISGPARGGYGLPTLYFVLQGVGLLIQRSRVGRRLGLGRGFVGRIFAAVIIVGGAFWLFHPPFVHEIVLPMMRACGASASRT